RGDDEVLDDLLLLRLDQRVVDLHRLHLALAGEFDADEAAAGRAFDFEPFKLRLHRFHLRLELGGLLHQAEKIRHGCSLLLLATEPIALISIAHRLPLVPAKAGTKARSTNVCACGPWIPLCGTRGGPGGLILLTVTLPVRTVCRMVIDRRRFRHHVTAF